VLFNVKFKSISCVGTSVCVLSISRINLS
jgi:hypothetical protein